MFIQAIRIKNFRSIVNETIKLDNESLSIFVGRNDAGKSNILRALNLFFNGQTDHKKPFRFEDDFSFVAQSGKGKAKEVFIELTITPPSRMKGAQTFKWIKRWRADGTVREPEPKFRDGKLVSSKYNSIWAWLLKLKFRYVPAQKDSNYFRDLMQELHDGLVEAHGNEFTENAEGFIRTIQSISEDVSNDLDELVGIPNKIQAPSDFRLLFSNLDFGEEFEGHKYLLERRGDGLKAWHVPVILRVIAKKEKELNRPGYVSPDTIWGFEEPENNLELSNAFKVANQFHSFSKDIQILLTTHSPAFYSLPERPRSRARRFFISKAEDGRTTRLIDKDVATIDQEMGILHLITPHVVEANDRVLEMTAEIQRLERRTIATPFLVLCEDSENSLLQVLLRSSGIGEFTIEPYHGKSNILGAFQFSRIIKRRDPDIKIIVHRDRDYLSDEETSELQRKATNAGCFLFLTVGTDVESHFLNPGFIAASGLISFAEATGLIEEATENKKSHSIDLFSCQTTGIKVARAYEADPERYRHGKTVLNEVKNLYHRETSNRLSLTQENEHLRIPELAAFIEG